MPKSIKYFTNQGSRILLRIIFLPYCILSPTKLYATFASLHTPPRPSPPFFTSYLRPTAYLYPYTAYPYRPTLHRHPPVASTTLTFWSSSALVINYRGCMGEVAPRGQGQRGTWIVMIVLTLLSQEYKINQFLNTASYAKSRYCQHYK